MSANASEKMVATPPIAKQAPTEQQESQPGVPKKIVNAQTVCNEKNEKGKLCNGHLKQLKTGGEPAEAHLRGNDVLFKCQTCGTLYMGPPLGHLRDPDKQQRFVERELTALLQAAGGTLPAIIKNERGVYVLAEETGHGHAPKPTAPAAPAAAKPAPAKPAPAAEEKKASVAAAKPAAVETKPAPAAEVSGDFVPYVPPPAPGPVPGETQEQKLARLRAIVAEAKRRKALAGGDMSSAPASGAEAEPSALARDSSTAADAHRPAAEAQAATGQASAAPMSPAAATASPAAGAESVEDLAPEASTELTPGAPPADEAAATQPASKAKPAARTATGTVTRQDYDTGPVPGETHEQKIARLTALVEEVKRRAGKL
ncbi:MAG: hypothetical protein AUG51_13395 [Acidobacteria bacterium 13_1_20CM_3_53_8]|nr:MAG: hypothetical protein AUG51_13395 [Acidobacteria bacterium 13_1_20CM_3_53_8]